MKSVDNTFSPELINRIDERIIFHSLSEEDIFEIIDLQLASLHDNLSKIGFFPLINLKINLLIKNYYQTVVTILTKTL